MPVACTLVDPAPGVEPVAVLAADGRVLATEPTDVDTVAARLLTQAGCRKPETG